MELRGWESILFLPYRGPGSISEPRNSCKPSRSLKWPRSTSVSFFGSRMVPDKLGHGETWWTFFCPFWELFRIIS
jgi:hypothetical protein